MTKFPRYAIFGDGYSSWEVNLLKGHGKVEVLKTITVSQIINEAKKNNKTLSCNQAYSVAKDKAIAHKDKISGDSV